jgi:hypothetical protein
MNDNDYLADANRYRGLSKDAYADAKRTTDPECQRVMRQIGLSYHHLALLAEKRNLGLDLPSLTQPSAGTGPT